MGFIMLGAIKACVLSLLISGAAAADAESGTAPEATLYARLGGKAVITKLVSDLIDHSIQDPRTRRSFEKVNLKRLKEKVEEQVCSLTGGPCKYTGDDMRKSHAGLDITEAEFYGFVEALIDMLDRYNIGLREKNQLLAILAPMKRDIVTR
jgi:hemoglobin